MKFACFDHPEDDIVVLVERSDGPDIFPHQEVYPSSERPLSERLILDILVPERTTLPELFELKLILLFIRFIWT